MANIQPQGAVETGAEMNYPEHERTYAMFTGLVKYTLLLISALLISMALGFFTPAGFVSAVVAFVLISAGGAWVLR